MNMSVDEKWREHMKVYQKNYYQEHKEKILEKIKLRYESDEEFRKKRKEYRRKYYIKNKI